MNVVNLHSSCTMILLSILASTTIIGLTSSTPSSSYERKDLSTDRPKLFLLVDQKMPEVEIPGRAATNEILDSDSDSSTASRRIKRIGSLSIINSLDVLRQRVLLELARRKALEDQRQIDANRRFLETIGKRSVPEYGPHVDRIAMNQPQQPQIDPDRLFLEVVDKTLALDYDKAVDAPGGERFESQRQQQQEQVGRNYNRAAFERARIKAHDWFEKNARYFSESQDH